jgi:hypothetical protein
MTGVCFVDTETTGLDPERHQIWEVALITPGGDEHVSQFPIVELSADPFALEVGHYWERQWGSDSTEISATAAIFDAHKPSSRRKFFPKEGRAVTPGEAWARYFRDLTAGCHLVGAVVSFDEERLRKLLRSRGVLPRWQYHLIDVEALAAGYISAQCVGEANDGVGRGTVSVLDENELVITHIDGRPPWNSGWLSRAVGVDPEGFDRHTALGDARWAKAIYEAVMGTHEAGE